MVYNIDGLPSVQNDKKSISILFVGNSLTQDGIAYLPYMLHTYYPEIDFRFYMWYIGGYTLAQQYEAFVNETKTGDLIFSVAENTSNWTNYLQQKSMKDVLSEYEFDIVCFQEFITTNHSANLTDWNNCRNYILDNYAGNNALEFISLFHAPSCNSPVATNFEHLKTDNAYLLHDTISQDMIPMGIAKYRALATELDSLGDAGHLTVDGTHAQEGLPCLLQTFCVMCWLFDKLAINKSIYGSDARITTAVYNSINVPGPNLGTGVITGTDAQNLIAQEVAIKAYKEGKQFVVDNLFSTN